jgi:adenylosuccinate lyase
VDYLLDRTRRTVDKLFVYPERMRANLELTRGLIFSGQLLLDLAAKGVLREEAYLWVQRNAMRAWEHGEDFRNLVEADPDIRRTLTPAELDAAFSLPRQLRHVDAIFARVFGT